jgi:hypothetical protein
LSASLASSQRTCTLEIIKGKSVAQVSLLDIKNSFPSIEAFNNERVKILFKTKTSKDGSKSCHSSAVTGEMKTPGPFFRCAIEEEEQKCLDLAIEVVWYFPRRH